MRNEDRGKKKKKKKKKKPKTSFSNRESGVPREMRVPVSESETLKI